jgi:hypothetical protein
MCLLFYISIKYRKIAMGAIENFENFLGFAAKEPFKPCFSNDFY